MKVLNADEKVELLERAIDVLIEVADAGMGNYQTADALEWINRQRSKAFREQEGEASAAHEKDEADQAAGEAHYRASVLGEEA